MQVQLLLLFVLESCRSYYAEANKGFQDSCNSCLSSSISLHRMMALKRVRSAFPLCVCGGVLGFFFSLIRSDHEKNKLCNIFWRK